MKILVVDDHEIVRAGLASILSRVDGLEVVGHAATGREALAFATAQAPDVAIVDLRLPDMGGDELCRRLLAETGTGRVVILSTYLGEEAVRHALQAGAVAYVTKAAGVARLRAVLADIADDRLQAPAATHAPQIVDELHRLVARRMEAPPVTPRQEQVLELAARGLTNRQVGARLFISESTVRFHVRNLKALLGARTRTELIARAIRTGAIAPAGEDDAAR